MSIHRGNATGKWRVVYRYTDWAGETHQSSKRGFSTKREAQMWERELLLKKEAKKYGKKWTQICQIFIRMLMTY